MAKNSKQKYWALLIKDLEGRRSWKPSQSYLKVYFNIMYYLLFIPFKVQSDKKSGEYFLVSNRFQKVRQNKQNKFKESFYLNFLIFCKVLL